MREIEYRAWHKTEKVMGLLTTLSWDNDGNLKGGFLVGVKPGEDSEHEGFTIIAPAHGRFCTLDELELMEFTGLLDKHGTKVFEGDIVNIKFTNRDLGGIEELKSKPIIWSKHNCAFAVDNGEWHEGLNGIVEIEVIGNIYQHRHLLTGDN